MKKNKYDTIAIGGTFSVIHKGHIKLMIKAFEISSKVIIGLTSDSLVHKMKKVKKVIRYQIREKNLKTFLNQKDLLGRAEIVPLYDFSGPTTREENIEAVVVSNETVNNAYKINTIRKSKGFSPLDIIVIEMELTGDGEPISTTRILKKEIDEQGNKL